MTSEPLGTPFVDERYNVFVVICPNCRAEATAITAAAISDWFRAPHLPSKTAEKWQLAGDGRWYGGRFAIKSAPAEFVIGERVGNSYRDTGMRAPTLCAAAQRCESPQEHQDAQASSAA